MVIGEGLASQLNLQVNDTLVLLGQGYHASTAAGKYSVTGIIKLGAVELNNAVVYMPLELAQYMCGAENRLTSISLMLDRTNNLESMKRSLEKTIDSEKESLYSHVIFLKETCEVYSGELFSIEII